MHRGIIAGAYQLSGFHYAGYRGGKTLEEYRSFDCHNPWYRDNIPSLQI